MDCVTMTMKAFSYPIKLYKLGLLFVVFRKYKEHSRVQALHLTMKVKQR